MIGIEPRWAGRPAIKPGHLPEPEKRTRPLREPDPKEIVDICLSCKLPECSQESKMCPLRTEECARAGRGRPRKDGPNPGDEKIGRMICAGWRDGPLCRELGISEQTLQRAKWRLRKKKGEIV